MSSRLFSYFPSDSVMHRMDALSKFLWLFLISITPFVLWQAWQVALQVLFLLLIAVLLGDSRLSDLWRSWGLFAVLGSLIFFFHVSNRHEGQLLFRIWFLPIHSDGMELGSLFGLRVVAIMGASYIFVTTTNPRDLVVAFIRLGVPYRYAWMLFVALVSLPIYEAEFVVVREAQMVRGVKRTSNPISERLQMYKRYMMPMLASGLRRVENLAVGMDARGFGAYDDRSFIDEFSWSRSGLLLLFLTTTLFVGLFVARITGGYHAG